MKPGGRGGWPARRHVTWWAFCLHRVSGLLLALFLPAHFWMLALAVRDEAAFGGFMAWTERPLVKFAEAGLVALLAVHLAGGLRLLALELLPWRDGQKNLAAVAFGFALAAGLGFLLAA